MHDFADAERGGEVGDAEDQPGHAVRGGGDGVRVDDGLGNFDQGFDLHAGLPARSVFQAVEQVGDVFDVVRVVRLGQDDAMKLVGRALNDRFQVAQEEFGADVVGPHGDDLLAEIQRIECLNDTLAALRPLEFVRAGVLEIHHHVIDRRLDGVGRVLV